MKIEYQSQGASVHLARLLMRLSGLEGSDRTQFASIIETLVSAQGDGHTCIGLTADQKDLVARSSLAGEGSNSGKPLVIFNNCLYLARYFDLEQNLGRRLAERATENSAVHIDEIFLDQCFGETEKSDSYQRRAARTALEKKLCIISGGPGTGKTTTVVKIIALLLGHFGTTLRIALAAPTGKAAMRMMESVTRSKETLTVDGGVKDCIPDNTFTIHRLLGVRKFSPSFRHNRRRPLPYDVVIIDEASMVDISLMSRLVDALSNDARLILLGDKNQLASVEAGAILSDCIRALPEHVVELENTYRFNRDISTLSRAINSGDIESAVSILEDDHCPSVSWADVKWPEYAVSRYSAYMRQVHGTQTLDQVEGLFELFNNFKVLCTVKRGLSGVSEVNSRIEKAINLGGIPCGRDEWFPGRPILITRNDYNHGLYNGDIGLCLPDFTGDNELMIWFNQHGVLRKIHPQALPECQTAWALTIHKSQGSEFDEVLVILPEKDMPVLTRELLYTAVTRARKKVQICGKKNIIELTLGRRVSRLSGLMEAIRL